MSELYDHPSHEPVTDTAWSEAAARAAIGEIAADAEAAFDPETLWHAHPLDTDGGPLPSPTGFYLGASGVIWALDALRRAGAVERRRDWPEVAAGLPDRYAAAPDLPEWTGGGAVPSLLVGEAGILLVAHRLAPAQWQVDRLLEVVCGNVHNPTRELMWGSPGTMLAAQLMHERARDDRFADAWRESADWLWDEWGDELWLQDMYGQLRHYVGPGHGFAANVMVLARGGLLHRAAPGGAGAPVGRRAAQARPARRRPRAVAGDARVHPAFVGDPHAVVPRRSGDRHLVRRPSLPATTS